MRFDEQSACELQNASKRLGGRAVLDGLDLVVRPRGVTALLGANGVGKTTAIGLLTGRLVADAGTARVFGIDPRQAAARARMGVMLQAAGLPETLTVGELVRLQSGYYAAPRPVAETLGSAGLSDLADRRCGALSGGQARRVQYALAICGKPDLLVLDEPTVGMDREARLALWDTVREMADAGAAVLLTTHALDEADALADRILVLTDGRIFADDTPAAIRARVAGTSIRCRTGLPDAVLAALPAVRRIEHAGAETRLLSTDAAASARALLAADPQLADLRIVDATLEDAFAALVPPQARPSQASPTQTTSTQTTSTQERIAA